MAFDPDKFLQESSEPAKPTESTGGFDPNKFLAEPQAPVLQVSLKEAVNKNPDEYAKVVNLANKNKLPVDFTERNYQDLEKQSRSHQGSYDQILKKTPAFASWLQDAKNAALVNDEIPQQQKIEESVKEYSVLSQMYSAFWSGVNRQGADAAGIPALIYDTAAAPLNRDLESVGAKGDDFIQSPDWLRNNPVSTMYQARSEAWAKEAPLANESITDSLNLMKVWDKAKNMDISGAMDELSSGDFSKAGRILAVQMAQNAPQMATLIIGGIAGMAKKSLAVAGATTASSANTEAQNAIADGTSEATPQAAVTGALVKGGIEVGFESIGTFGVMKTWENSIAKTYGKEVSGRVMKDFFKTMFYSVAAEGNEEALTSVAQDLTDYVTGVNPEALEGIGQRALDAGFVGAAMGGGMTAPGGIAQGAARLNQGRKAQLAQDFYTNMGETVKNLKLKERSPEAQQQYLETATKGTQVENVYVSTEAIEAYFQGPKKKGEETGDVPQGTQATPDNTETLKALQELGLLEKYEEAKRTGADMEIPFAEWAVKTSGSPIYNALVNDIKFNVDEPTASEIQADRDAERQMLEAEAKAAEENDRIANVKALEESSKAVGQDIEKQSRAAGQSSSQAKAHAKLYESTFRSLGKKVGIDPLELYNRYNLSIGRAEVQAAPVEGEEVLNQGEAPSSPEFKNWFGESKVVDESGNPLVVYHGTNKDFSEFSVKQKNDHGYYGEGYYFTPNQSDASFYADLYSTRDVVEGEQSAPNVMPVYLSIKNPYVIYKNNFSGPQYADEFTKDLKEKGYDGIIVRLRDVDDITGNIVADDITEIIVFEPNQIKSAIGNRGTFDPNSPNILKQSANPTYSRVEQLVSEKMGGSASPDQIKGMLRDMKPEEMKWLGIDEFLKGKKKVTKEEMLEHIRANAVEIVDVTKGENKNSVSYIVTGSDGDFWVNEVSVDGDVGGEVEGPFDTEIEVERKAEKFNSEVESDDTKFSQYTLPGGENYREVLFTLPQKSRSISRKKVGKSWSVFDNETGETLGEGLTAKEADSLIESNSKKGSDYQSSHFDEKNILAHVRLNDRTDSDGKKVLFVEEIQSDWHQEGRKKGYKGDTPDVKVEIARLESEMKALVDQYKPMALDNPDRKPLVEKYKELQNQKSQLENSDYKQSRAVPDAPFKKTWHEYAMKRIIRMAAEGGYDKVAWTTGEQQAERYDLSKQVDQVKAMKLPDGQYYIEVLKDRSVIMEKTLPESDLEENLGKDLSAKIIAGEGKKAGAGTKVYEGGDLKVGGEGMKGFYDNILVKSTDKLVKKFGAKVGETIIEAGERELDYTEKKLKAIQADLGDLKYSDFKKNESESDDYRTIYDLGNNKTVPRIIVINETGATSLQTKQRNERFRDLDDLKNTVWGEAEDTTIKSKVHSLEITPQLRDEALNQGFSLFQDERGQIRFGKNGINIDLFKNADASTFLHETGHFYFKVLGDLAKSENAPQQIKDDYETLLKWMNVTDPNNISVEAQEQFARGFEAYLLEGKAPTKELKSAFARFKVWLLDVYKSIRNLNVELSDDIRAVMDRLVATDEQIEIANQEIQRVPLFDDARSMGMSEAQAKKYTELRTEAQETASEQLAADILKDFYKTKKKEYKAKRKAVRAEVEAEVSKYQPYVTLDQLRTGEQSSGMPMKLDRASVVKMMGPEFLKRLPRPVVYTKKGEAGLHPDIAASYMGYESGDDMLTQLANLPPKNQVIESLTDQRMKQFYPDTLTPQALPQAAMEAVHNEKQAEVLMMELEMLAVNDFKGFMKNVVAKTVKRLPTKKIVQEEADNIIGSRKITDIKPYIYKRAEIKSAKLAGEALAKGDIDEAFNQKRKELLNFELYNSATRALEQIKKDKQLYKKLAKSDEDLAKTRDLDYINAARALLAEYGLGDTEKSSVEYLEKVRSYSPEQYEGLVEIINASMESDATNYEDMAYSDFRAMNDVVKALWDLSREAKTIEVEGKKESLNQAREDLTQRIDEISKPQESKKYTQAMSETDKKKTVLLGAIAKLRRFEHWVDSMDDGKITGVFRKYLYQPVSEATDKYVLKRSEYLKRYKAEFDKLKVDPTKEIVSKELGHKFFNKYEILGALLHRGNNSNFEKLLVGRSWGSVNEAGQLDSSRWDAFEKRMQDEGILTKEDYDFVQKVWDMMDELKPDAQKTNKKVFGFYFDEITANSFTNRFGTYKGGYAPAAIDTDLVSTIRNKQLRDQIINGQDSYAMPYSGGKGFTKSRVNSNKPLALDLRIFTSHLDQVLRFTYVKPAVMDASKILLQDEFKSKMDEFDPKIVEDMLLPALNRADKGTARQMSDATNRGLMRYANKFKTNSSMQLMFVNIPNTLQQITGFSVAALKVSGLKMGESMLNYMKRSKDMTNEIAEKSTFMKTRFETQVFDIERDIEGIMKNKTGTLDKMNDWAIKHMYVAQTMAQNVMDAVIWEASYNQSIAENMSESQAVKKADSVVRTTQSSFRPMDISASESNPFFSLVQMFYSYFNTMLNVNAAEFEKLARSDLGIKKKFQKGIIIYTLGYMIPAFVGDLVVQAMRGSFDDDEDGEITDDLLSTFFWSQLRFGTAMIPLVGAPIMAGINRANDKPWDDRTSMSPAFTGLTTIAGTAIDTGKAIFSEDEVNAKRLTKDALTTIGLLSGLPVGAAGRPIGYMIDVEEGSKEPTGPIDFTRGLISGN